MQPSDPPTLPSPAEDHALAIALEHTEATYWSRYYDDSPALRCKTMTLRGAVAVTVPDIDMPALNRVIGLGLSEPVRPGDIKRLVDFYEEAGAARFFIQLSPHILQADLPEMLADMGFRHHNNWVKLMRPVAGPMPEIQSTLTATRLTETEKPLFGRIIFDSFGWEDPRLASWLSNSVGKPGYQHFAARLAGVPVGVAALHIQGSYASLAFAGTLPDYRSLGAQQLLMQVRLEAARAAGCRYLIAETAEPTPEKPVISYNNMLRFGLQDMYRRANWIFPG